MFRPSKSLLANIRMILPGTEMMRLIVNLPSDSSLGEALQQIQISEDKKIHRCRCQANYHIFLKKILFLADCAFLHYLCE
jgi:hypothetical protein